MQLLRRVAVEVLERQGRETGEDHQLQGMGTSYDGLRDIAPLVPEAVHVRREDGLLDVAQVGGGAPTDLHVANEKLREVESDRRLAPEPVVDQDEPVSVRRDQQVVGAGI